MTFRSLRTLEIMYLGLSFLASVGLPLPFIMGPPWFNGTRADWIIVGIICLAELCFALQLTGFLWRRHMRKMGEEIWEDRSHSDEWPTVNSFVIQAQDVVKTKGIYRLVVCHVLFNPGREGFVYSIHFMDGNTWSPTENGEVLPGTDRRTWLKVKKEGLKRFREMLEERKHRMQQYPKTD